VALAEERDQVVLAQGRERDVATMDHLIVFGREGDGEEPGRVFTCLVEEPRRTSLPLSTACDKTFSVGVLTDSGQELANRPADTLPIDRSAEVILRRGTSPVSLIDGLWREATRPGKSFTWALRRHVHANVGRLPVKRSATSRP